MPTIPELPSAVQTGFEDEIPVSQGGVTRAVTVAELLSGTQQLIEVPSPSVLGRASLGPGGPEALALGLGLGIQAASLAANGGDHAAFVQESTFGSSDEVIVNAAGTPKRLPVSALRSLFVAGHNISIDTTGIIAASTDSSVSGSLVSLSQSVSAAQANISALASKIPSGGFVSLNSSGQITAPVVGDVSAATVISSNGVTARSLAARLVDIINVLDFGTVMGGPDCSAAFNAAFAALPLSGGELWIPPGDYYLASPVTLSGKAVVVTGSGKGQTRLHLQHMGIGLDISPINLFNKAIVRDMSIYAESPSGQTAAAIRITYPSISAFGYITSVVSNVELFGYPNSINTQPPFPQTFLRGVVLDNCWSSELNSVSWFGPPAPAGSTTSAVVELNGSVDTRIHCIQAYYGNAVVLQSGYCEGIYLSSPLVVGADYLIRQTDETTWSGYSIGRAMLLGLWAANGEVNTNLGTVQLSNVTDGFFANLDITRDGGPATSQILFNFTNVSNFHVSGCNFVGGPSGGPSQDVAFQFQSTFNSSSNIVSGCHFEDMATVIKIIGPNGTVGLTTFGLHLGNVPLATAIVDPTAQEVGNYISFTTPSQAGIPAGVGNTKDHVLANANGSVLFRVNNFPGTVNFIRHQPSTSSNSPTICFDGTDATVGGVIQTKGGSLSVSAAGGSTGGGNLISLLNTAGATNWIVAQNATEGSLSLLGTNAGGLSIQPKGVLSLSPVGGIFISGLPTSKPLTGSGQVWNNGGVLNIA